MGKGVRLIAQFGGSDERWTRNRSVTDLSWSTKYPELLLSAYSRNPSAPSDPDGVLLVWNMHVSNRPEFTFHCQSEITAAAFSPFHPKLVVGGTYSGQIVLWDMRANTSAPSLKSPLSAGAGHTHPVFGLQVIGTLNAHHLLSTSTDGQMCAWQMDMLAQPLVSFNG
jgi:dynein intermediate chain